MDGVQIGYARVSTSDQDLTAQRDALLRLGVHDEHIYVDHGMTGANRPRPGLREALAVVRSGDTSVVTKLDRLARSRQEAREIADELTGKGVAPSLGGSRKTEGQAAETVEDAESAALRGARPRRVHPD
jgi:predicted site-specific integrase-resolvase